MIFESHEDGCGATIGHGEYCSKGWLCTPCQELVALEKEVVRLTEKCNLQAKVLRQLDVAKYPGPFITLGSGDVDSNGMEKWMWVVPTMGCGFMYQYERTGKTMATEGS